MHELSITENILKIVIDEGKKNNVNKINTINIKMGALSELLPECINYYFDIISKGTIAEGALLKVNKLPLKVYCNHCKNISETDIRNFRCTLCKSQNVTIKQGNEFYVDSIDVE